MTKNKTTWLAALLCGLVIVLLLFGLFNALHDPTITSSVLGILNLVGTFIFTVCFAVVGALILGRHPGNTIGWLLMAIALLISLSNLLPSGDTLAQQVAAQPQPSFLLWLLIWFNGISWWGLIGPLLLIPLLFPNGHLLTPRWRWGIVLIVACFFIFVVVDTLQLRLGVSDTVSISNPVGFIPQDVTSALLLPWQGLLLATAATSVISLLMRYHRAAAVPREQIKWLVYACAIFIITYALGFIGNFSDTDFFGVLFNVGITAIPVAIGIAILRSRLFDIDVIIRRTFTYAILAALLAAFYFGSVILLQQIFASVSGQRSEIITVLSTLALAALFVPLRNRIQSVIDKRFNRKKYDAQQVLTSFAATVRDETDLTKLTGNLMGVVNETMQPKSVSLWLTGRKESAKR